MNKIYHKLKKEVIDSGLCTHCGTCAGLSNNKIEMKETDCGPLPIFLNDDGKVNELLYDACPGKGFNYPLLSKNIFSSDVKDWRIGYFKNIYVGYSKNPSIRRNGASGGIITNILIYLLNEGLIDGAITVKQGASKPWLAEPIIATNEKEILECAQSVYSPIPVNKIINKIIDFKGDLAFVGLPDHISSIRYLKSKNIEWTRKIKYILGPYVGTNLYTGAIKSFIRSHGYKDLVEIEKLKYRDGEWPGYLKINMKDKAVLKSEKFYYNYLIPFYVTKSSLLSVDFSNELADISVGDAWSPKYENLGEGYSVIVARSKIGSLLLTKMQRENIIELDKIKLSEATSMHAHMIDFKKRGAFIRFKFRKLFKKNIPDFGYRPDNIPFSRILIETFISTIFFLCSLSLIRRLVVYIPIKIIGPFFNFLRIKWKSASKTSKRKGLEKYSVKLN
tara:strand:- start:14492 stop:15832 length:1341 start_codon:yes stop_codon:yes gene_type:complete